MKFDNLLIRWTFGETASRNTSLQAFDMLETSILLANFLFPEAEKVLVYNNLIREDSYDKIRNIAKNTAIKLLEAPTLWKNHEKNSFYKYVPERIAPNKYELFLDADVLLWKIPETLLRWYHHKDALLINSDWNGRNYGIFQEQIPEKFELNAGILGIPPNFRITLPDVEKFPEKFASEQGFITNYFLNSGKKLFILSKQEIFQANAQEFLLKKYENLTQDFAGAHFCGNLYSHYFHWDKFYKYDVKKILNNFRKYNEFFNLRDISKHNPKVKKGLVFRSGTLTFLQKNPKLYNFLKKHNIQTIIDLRADRELVEHPYSKTFKKLLKHKHIPFAPWKQPEHFRKKYQNHPDGIHVAYLFFLQECKPQIKEVMQTILHSPTPVLIHCHAGKDRTGIIITLLHLLAGASWKTAEKDFLASLQDATPRKFQWIKQEIETFQNVENYLKSCDLTNQEIQQLKQKITAP